MKNAFEFRKKIRDGKLIIGGHTFLNDPSISEALAFHGYEFIWIDAEHGSFSNADILHHTMAIASAGAMSIVRVAWNDPIIIKPILEMGPDGIIAPMINSAEDAESFIKACQYPLKGNRGFGPRRANHYGAVPINEYLESSSERILKIIQIEHILAVENLNSICKIDGIDLIIVGPNDLSGSLGCLGDTRNSMILDVFDKIADTCIRNKVPFGVSLGPQDELSIKEWLSRGISVISCGDDISFISIGAKKTIGKINELLTLKM